MNKSDNLNQQREVQVTIDNERVALPEWLSNSLASIKTYLECLVIKKERVLWTLCVNGVKVDPMTVAIPMDIVHQIQVSTITFDSLTDQLISAGQSKLAELASEIEAAVLIVVINEPEAALNLWKSWEPQLREPLLSLRALKELKGDTFFSVDGVQALVERIEELGMIVSEVETLFDADDGTAPDMVVLSEILEFTLLPWLNSVGLQFDQLNRRLQERLRLVE